MENFILVQEVKSADEIKSLKLFRDEFPFSNIYELSQNDDRERIFRKHSEKQCNWYDKLLGNSKLDNCYYIYPGCVSLFFEVDIRHRDAHGPVTLTLELTVRLDMENSDFGKGLADWLAEHGGDMDKESLKSYVQAALKPGILEDGLGLKRKSWPELRSGNLHFGPESFRDILPHWISVDCKVNGAVEKMTQSQIDREDEVRRQAERKRRYQLRSEMTMGVQIEGTPWPTERIMLGLNGVQLELYAMKKATLGRVTQYKVTKYSDVVVTIPQGCPDEEKRREQEEKPTLSCIHTELKWRGDAVRVKNMSRIGMTYINEKEIPGEGTDITGDVELGFSWEVRWQARVQKCTGRLQLPCCDGCAACGISSMILAYPGWTKLYKVFVWQCCVLRQVDSRLPNWRVVYQSEAQGTEGAFYLLTDNGRCIYLQPDQEIVEDGGVMSVKSI
ncbi:MAG: hypothetical protein J6X49_00295 [Victivallales bacterium]|nr:hypothetical protein [Victivallales bacterium]